MQRILLLMEHRENRRLLRDWLGDNYRVIAADSEGDLNQPFDLCVLDGPALDRYWQAVQARKAAEPALFLPFLLTTSRQDAGPQTRQLWQGIDEFISHPVEKAEMQARIEILLRARRQSVELKRRNDDLEALAQALGHDLRAPVRIAGSFAAALLENDNGTLGELNRRYAARIQAAVGDMDSLITSLLGLIRLGREEVRLRPVQVRTVVDSCLRSLESDVQACGADVQVSEDLPEVEADTLLLKMALTNLLTNALKFVAVGTHPVVQVYATRAGELCRLWVQDNGVGIPPEEQGRIFEPFVRLYGEEDYVGVGLGLPTARKAVELMGGSLGVVSAQGGGTIFWLELPRAGNDGAGQEPVQRSEELARGGAG